MSLIRKGSPLKPNLTGLPNPLFFGFVALTLLVLLISPVWGSNPNASNALNLSDWDTHMSWALGFDDSGFVGGIILTLILLALCVLPIVMIARKRNWGEFPEIVMMFVGLVAGVALEWVSYWVLLMVVLMVSLLYSSKIRDWASGGGK